MTSKETELQREIHDMVQKTTELEEEFNREKNRLTEELNLMAEEIKSSQVSYSGTDSLHSDNSVFTLVFVFAGPVMYQTFS